MFYYRKFLDRADFLPVGGLTFAKKKKDRIMRKQRHDLPYEAFCRWFDTVENKRQSNDSRRSEPSRPQKATPVPVDFTPVRATIWAKDR